MVGCGGVGSLLLCLQLIARYHEELSNVATECSSITSVVRHHERVSKEYKLFNEKATHTQAEARCQSWGTTWKSISGSGRLASINNIRTHACVAEMIKTEGNYEPQQWRGVSGNTGYFIGGSTDHTEWSWPEGLSVPLPGQRNVFQQWGDGHPNQNNPGRRCMVMILDDEVHEAGAWVEQPCDEEMFFICEREIPKQRVWGYANNAHAILPRMWSAIDKEEYSSCNGNRQSPVDIDSDEETVQPCDGEGGTIVTSWHNDSNVKWSIENTGRMIKIKTLPERSVYATMRGSSERHYVDYMLLKFGATRNTGSEHTIAGNRHEGELQIFHHPVADGEERQAVSFMLEEETFQPNENWAALITNIGHVQEPDASTLMEAPLDNIVTFCGIRRLFRKEEFYRQHSEETLLGDSVAHRRYNNMNYITEVGIRYKGSLPHPPCTEDVTWTVYTRPIKLSFSQFNVLRHLRMEGRDEHNRALLMSGNVRPIQLRQPQSESINRHCSVRL